MNKYEQAKDFIKDEQGNPLRFYHGTVENFKEFEFSKNHNLFYGTTSIDFANFYATEGVGSNVRPMYIKSAKPWDFRKTEHLNEFGEIVKRNLNDKFLNEKMGAALEGLSDEKKVEKLKAFASFGNWRVIETPTFLDELKAKGYTGVFTKENNAVNFGAFNPKDLVSSFDVDATSNMIKNSEVSVAKVNSMSSEQIMSMLPKKIDKTKPILNAIEATPGKLKKSSGVVFKAIETALKL